jgi:enediyne biosynthesis protein E4
MDETSRAEYDAERPITRFRRAQFMPWEGIKVAGFIAAVLLSAASSDTAAQSAGPKDTPVPPYFTDVTARARLTGLPGFRVTVCDINGDGYEDILLTRQNDAAKGDVYGKQMVLLNVPGDNASDPHGRRFKDFTAESNILVNRAGTNNGHAVEGMVGADVDNDGDNDLFLISYIHRTWDRDLGKNDLLINDGRGHFTMAANSPFHLEPQWNTAAASFVDYDLDGKLDLLLANWYDGSGKSQAAQLYKGNGDGSFANVTAASGIGSKKVVAYASAVSDWDNDGWPDLFLPNYGWTQPECTSLHFRNDRNGSFTPVQAVTNYNPSTLRLNGIASFGSMFSDYDNDGDMDFIEVMTHGTGDGEGSVHTTTVTNTNGIFTWEYGRVKGRGAEDPNLTHHGDHIVSYIDFDNDGLIDFLLTENGYGNNGLHLFRQGADHTFSPVTRGSGLWPVNEAGLPSHNAAVFDFDHDGDADILVGFGDDSTGIRLYRNDAGAKNHWIQIRLEGTGTPGKSNWNATGARIEVTAGGITRTREVFMSNGHQAPQIPFTQYFGLGSSAFIDTIRIRWPNASHVVTELHAVPADQFLVVKEPIP